jgi:hypothetical protein
MATSPALQSAFATGALGGLKKTISTVQPLIDESRSFTAAPRRRRGPVGPAGRTFEEITGTEYVSEEERDWYHAQQGRAPPARGEGKRSLYEPREPLRARSEEGQGIEFARDLVSFTGGLGRWALGMAGGAQEAERIATLESELADTDASAVYQPRYGGPPGRPFTREQAISNYEALQAEQAALEATGERVRSPQAERVAATRRVLADPRVPRWAKQGIAERAAGLTSDPITASFKQEIPIVSEFMREDVRPFVGRTAERAVNALAPVSVLDVVGVRPGRIARSVAEALVPATAGEFALEAVPGVGTTRGVVSAARPAIRAGAGVAGRRALQTGSPAVQRAGARLIDVTGAQRPVMGGAAAKIGGLTKAEIKRQRNAALSAPRSEADPRQLREVWQPPPEVRSLAEGFEVNPAALDLPDRPGLIEQLAKLRASPKGQTAAIGRLEAQVKALDAFAGGDALRVYDSLGDELASMHGTSPQARAYIAELERIHNGLVDIPFEGPMDEITFNWQALRPAAKASDTVKRADLFGNVDDTYMTERELAGIREEQGGLNISAAGRAAEPPAGQGVLSGAEAIARGFREASDIVAMTDGELAREAARLGVRIDNAGLNQGIPLARQEAERRVGEAMHGAGGIPPQEPPPAPPTGGGPPEPPAGDPLQKLIGAIKGAQKLPEETEALQSGIRRQRAAAAYKARGGAGLPSERIQATAQALYRKGELPRAEYESVDTLFTVDEIESLKQRILDSKLQPYETLRADEALKKVLTGEMNRVQENELLLLERVFGSDLVKALQGKRPRSFSGLVADVLGVPRNLLASIDISGPGRQGMLLGPGHAKEWASSFKASVQAYASEDIAKQIDDAVRASPFREAADRAGLELTSYDSVVLSAREEAVLSRWLGNVPLIRNSQRAYSVGLNKLRQDVFDTYAAKWSHQGTLTPERAKSLATYINAATGRGNLPAKWSELSVLFFAPRLLASRFQVPLQLVSPNTDNAVRLLMARDLASFMSTGSALLGLGVLAGATVEMDPRSSDFARMRFGKTRIDPWGGYQPLVRYTTQMILGERKLEGGAIQEADRLGVFANFLRTKLSPAAGTAVTGITGEDLTRKSFIESVLKDPLDRESLWWQSFMPLFIQDVRDGFEEEGLRGGLMGSLSFVGVGASSYSTPAGDLRAAFKEATGQDFDQLLNHERQPFIDADERLTQLSRELEESRKSESATISRKKYDALSSISGLANTDIAEYRRQAGDIVSRSAIAYNQAVADGSIPEIRGGQSEAWQAVDGYWKAVEQARDPTTGVADYDKQDKLATAYLGTLSPEMRERVLDEISWSKDPTYREYIQARQSLQPLFEAENQAFAQYQQQKARGAPPGSLAAAALQFETYDAFEKEVKRQALAGAQAAAQSGRLSPEVVEYEAAKAAAKWLADQKLTEGRQYYRAKVVFDNPALMDSLRRWYPEQVARYLLEAEEDGKRRR